MVEQMKKETSREDTWSKHPGNNHDTRLSLSVRKKGWLIAKGVPPLPQGPSRAANMILRGMKIHCQRAMLSNLSCLSQISNNELLLVQWRHVFNSNKKHLRRRCHDSQATGSKLQRNYSAAPQSFNGSRWVASRLWNVWCTLRDCSFADADVSRFSLSLCLCLLTGTATMLRTWYTRHTLNNGKYPDT